MVYTLYGVELDLEQNDDKFEENKRYVDMF